MLTLCVSHATCFDIAVLQNVPFLKLFEIPLHASVKTFLQIWEGFVKVMKLSIRNFSLHNFKVNLKSLVCKMNFLAPEDFFWSTFLVLIKTPGISYIPFQSRDLCCPTVRHFITHLIQHHYCPVSQPEEEEGFFFYTFALFFYHMGQIKGTAGLNHHAVTNTGCTSVGGVSPD